MRCVLGARPRNPGNLQNICVDLLTLTIGNLVMIDMFCDDGRCGNGNRKWNEITFVHVYDEKYAGALEP